MRHLFVVSYTLLAGAAWAQETPPDVKATIGKGLAYLAREGTSWKEVRKCSSCHHGPMAIWGLNEGKKRGFPVDEKALAELTAWVLDKDDPAKVFPKPPAKDAKDTKDPKDAKDMKDISANQALLMLALAFETGEAKSDAEKDGLKKLLSLFLEQQRPDGSWGLTYVWEPLGSTPNVITTLALLALTSPAAPDLGPPAKEAQARALAWLESAKVEDTVQSTALKLLLWKRLGRPAADQEPLLKQVLALQNPDGGWSQAKDMPSDAYSTGQTLYVLTEAGFPLTDPALGKAQAFLTKNQTVDGSWAMSSRPGGPGGKPAKNTGPISYTATGWATMGLMRSTAP